MSHFEASQERVPRLIVLATAGSTNDELADLASAERLEPFTTMVTADQTAGRGRRDRGWTMPAGRGLAISVLLPSLGADAVPWLPLAAGLAMRDAVAGLLPDPSRATVKWPNDVLVGGRKVCGVLGRLAGGAAVIGAGVNVRLGADELPVPTATSLTLEGAIDDDLDDRLLAGYLGRLTSLVTALAADGPDELRAAVVAACDTIDREVRVELPDGRDLLGRAVGIGRDARLHVASDDGIEQVAAGDVVHLRPTG
jgi:BirA family transcriptional regulator, biotin operon repressor / biotin---[acetyl-CoA-carboxylase] ligase